MIYFMARPKEFERDEALRTAMQVFQRQGFGATTTDDLRHAIGIGRQSFYDTFKGKEEIYLEALQVYASDRFAMFLSESRKSKSPLEAIQRILLKIPREDKKQRTLSCLGVSSICEFGESNEEVSRINKSATAALLTLLATLVAEGQKKGEIKSALQASPVAQYLLTLIGGMRINARGGATPELMTQIIEVAVSGLKSG
jgi:TetR/AcrR family transcriptional regulator, transcriptional repressor for nem operon